MADLKLVIGRQRRTVVVGPSEAGYIGAIQQQGAAIAGNLKKVVAHLDNLTVEALEFGLKPIYDKSQELVPVDTGRLKRSGYYEARKLKSGATAEIGYGRYGNPTYAVFVHEIPMKHAPPTQWKYLEHAVDARIDDFRRRVALFLQRNSGLSN